MIMSLIIVGVAGFGGFRDLLTQKTSNLGTAVHTTHPQKENTMSSELPDPIQTCRKCGAPGAVLHFPGGYVCQGGCQPLPFETGGGTHQPSSAPSIEPLKRWIKENVSPGQEVLTVPTGRITQALAAYDLLSQRAERLEVCLKDCEKAWNIARGRVHANFGHVPEAIRACDWIGMAMCDALNNARIVLSEKTKEEK